MFESKKISIRISGLLLTLAAASAVPTLPVSIAPAVAQSANKTADYPLPESVLPKSLPSGKKVKVYGSSTMAIPNQALKKRLQAKYPGNQVQLATTSSGNALQALLGGKIDLAAVGRPLTKAEKDKGLVFLPLKREKIAIIVGSNNPFQKSLTFDQFSKIFRGEITDWSQVGGPKGKIRFIDRPNYSDTRLALSTYDVFKKAPFKTGSTATKVPQDSTAAIVQKLGKDGISYAIVEQAVNLKNVRVLPMHKVLPTDPRYPYSQVRGYVYKPGTFLIGVPPIEPTATSPEQPAPLNEKNQEKFPWWWLLLLLGIPLLGILLWWFLKGSKAKPVPPIVPPINPASGELIVDATWGNDQNEMNNLPSFTNTSDKTITVKFEADGTWSYGAQDETNHFDLQVDGNGNQKMAEKELQDNDMRFPGVAPAALVALKNGEVVGTGKGPYELTLKPNETVSFVINDQQGFYKDNNGKLTVKWSFVKTVGKS